MLRAARSAAQWRLLLLPTHHLLLRRTTAAEGEAHGVSEVEEREVEGVLLCSECARADNGGGGVGGGGVTKKLTSLDRPRVRS